MSLSSKNSELEKQIAAIKLECSMSFVSTAVKCTPFYFSVPCSHPSPRLRHSQQSTNVLLPAQSQIRRILRFLSFSLSSPAETTLFKWLLLDTVRMNFPNVELPIELHDMVYTETRSLSAQLSAATTQIDQLRADFETYKRKTRAATLKLQQIATQGKSQQAEAELREQVKTLQDEAEELRRCNESLRSQVETMEKAKKAAGRRSEGLKRRTKRRGRAGTAEREGADRVRTR